jgi:tetratricopeptide (TPR) repeat protein
LSSKWTTLTTGRNVKRPDWLSIAGSIMNAPIDFETLLTFSQGSADVLAIVDPKSVRSKNPAEKAWRLLSGSIALRRAGHRSEANDWFNVSLRTKQRTTHSVLLAEQLAEAGLALFGDKRWEEAAKVLKDAASHWDALCRVAVGGRKTVKQADAVAKEIAEMLVALGDSPKQSPAAATATRVSDWLENRAVLRYAEVLAAYARILAIAGQHDEARSVCDGIQKWISRNLTHPASGKPLPSRSMAGCTRHALYCLMLARGEVELAAAAFQASADSFGDAVTLYEGHAADESDISRMIQAHVNQANSLLRLGRYDEALGIYELAEMGFRSLDDEASVARIKHAKLFAQQKKAEGGGPRS